MSRIHGFLASLIAITGCGAPGPEAPGPASPGTAGSAPLVHSLAQVDVRPQLIACPGHNESGEAWVTVDFIVQADGTVRPGSVSFVRRSTGSRDPDVVQRAERAAATCLYEPALKDGEPVPVRVRRLFPMARTRG